MPNIEKLVTSLEVSRKLKELGVEQLSVFTWVKFFGEGFGLTSTFSHPSPPRPEWRILSYSAFTCTELAAMLDQHFTESDQDESSKILIRFIEDAFFSLDKVNANLKRFWREE